MAESFPTLAELAAQHPFAKIVFDLETEPAPFMLQAATPEPGYNYYCGVDLGGADFTSYVTIQPVKKGWRRVPSKAEGRLGRRRDFKRRIDVVDGSPRILSMRKTLREAVEEFI